MLETCLNGEIQISPFTLVKSAKLARVSLRPWDLGKKYYHAKVLREINFSGFETSKIVISNKFVQLSIAYKVVKIEKISWK